MYYYYDKSNKRRGPYEASSYEKWVLGGYFKTTDVAYDEDNVKIPMGVLVEMSRRNQKEEESAKSMFDDTMNMTNADVTLDLFNNSRMPRADQSTIYEAPDYSQISAFDESIIAEEPPEIHIDDLRRNVAIYIGKRSLINMKRNYPDTYLPFEKYWPDWVPKSLSLRESLNHALAFRVKIEELTRKVGEESMNKFMNSIDIPIRNCLTCRYFFKDQHGMLTHAISSVHINNLYSTSNRFLSSIDVFALDEMIHEMKRFKPAKKTYHIHRNESVFSTTNIAACFVILKSGIHIQRSIPLMMEVDPEKEEDQCEFAESLVILRDLQQIFENLDTKILQRFIGQTAEVKCGVCGQKESVSFFHSFVKHFSSERHIQSAIEKGVRRVEAEFWIGFCKSITKPKNDIKFTEKSKMSLQEIEFPLCLNPSRDEDDIGYYGHKLQYVMMFLRDQMSKFEIVFEDEEFKYNCQWCSEEVHSVSHLVKHILYDANHIQKITAISNRDIRSLLNFLQIPTTVPLFGLPGRDIGRSDVIMTGLTGSTDGLTFAMARKMQIKTELLDLLGKNDSRRVLASKMAFPLPLVNRCDICDVKIGGMEDILKHLKTNSHWEIMIKRHHWMENDFEFWWKIFENL